MIPKLPATDGEKEYRSLVEEGVLALLILFCFLSNVIDGVRIVTGHLTMLRSKGQAWRPSRCQSKGASKFSLLGFPAESLSSRVTFGANW